MAIIVSEMNAQSRIALNHALTPKMTRFITHEPSPKQTAFLLLDNLESFYGGAAGGGKSDALLMAALQYVDVPGYNAILFRKTYSDLALPEALMSRAQEWLAPFLLNREIRWKDKDKQFLFPTGVATPPATLTFGYMEHENDKYRYQSAAFQFVGWDELTQIKESQYTYMFSRLRRLMNVRSKVPLRVRSASNPGGEGHAWVQQRFLEEGPSRGRIFIPATIEDNPHLDREAYIQSLQELDPVTRAQLLEGNWSIRHGGRMFRRDWFMVVDIPPSYMHLVRYWDLAATEPTKKNTNPDWTVGFLIGEIRGYYFILDVVRFRRRPAEVEMLIRETAERDGRGVTIWIEQEPGASGVTTIDHYTREVLKGFTVFGNKSTGSKIERANPASAAAEQGRVRVLRAPWNRDFFDEIELFPDGDHDDQVDGFSGAFEKVSKSRFVSAMPAPAGFKDSYWNNIGGTYSRSAGYFHNA